ncbi:MAG TPA: bacillithiol system redox-active protein YtxJ [Chitinophagaceae bacterium]
MKWIDLTSEEQLNSLIEKSFLTPQVIFKYSSRCSLSDMIRDRLERKPFPADIDFYFLPIIAYRSVSDKIARLFSVRHESPQILVIRNRECVYEESHTDIRMDEVVAQSMGS